MEKTPGAFDAESSAKPFGIGCDHRETNEFHFKGAIKSVSLFSDVRTPEEIAADAVSVDKNDENLLVCYDLISYNDTDYVMSDLSKKGNDAYSTVNEPNEEEAPSTNDAILLPVFVALIALAGALTVAVSIRKRIKN